ncbi:piwi-like protein Ago3 [Orussus abietinus]|uniref:piwi-like protein Ago3 n=1 Tax=Orussus abietinus TaxID=222816 RepID=UPI0006264B98|nr:piwi-like protein Ago3 [Orussus abietinus]XP_012275657.1 piwi-like protein Ago3 [Orussus abietinus]
MADKGGGKPPSGRGASLLELMRARGVGAQASQSEAQSSPARVPGTNSQSVSTGRGRASILELVKQAQGDAPLIAAPPIVAPAPHSVGAGRASILQRLEPLPIPGPSHSIPVPSQSIPVPSTSAAGVANITTSLSGTSIGRSQSPSILGTEPISRHGESGTRVPMSANYINIAIDPEKGIFMYEVQYNPDIDSRPLRIKLLNQHMVALGGVKTFDGAMLYLPIKLPQEQITFQSEHPMDGSLVTLTVIYKRKQELRECIHFFNVLLGRLMNALSLVRIGRQNFNPRCAHPITAHRMELWPGYVTAINEYEGGLKLCIDATHRVMRTDTVRDLLHELYQRNPHTYRDAIIQEIIGITVLTRYNNRTYRIDDIFWDQDPTYKFPKKDGTMVSLIDYYKTHWNLEIRDKKQPLLVHRAKKKLSDGQTMEEMVILLPELCYCAGLTDRIRSDFRVMRDVMAVTRVSPESRQKVIRDFVRDVKSTEVTKNILTDWGLQLEDDIIQFTGRVLNPEEIRFGENQTFKGQNRADWGAQVVRMPMLRTPHLNRWYVLFCQKDRKYCEEFINTLRKVASIMKMNMAYPEVIMLKDDRTESYIRELRRNINSQVEMMMAICPTNRNDRYAAIKKLCCVEMPIPSQVIITKTISDPKKLKSVSEKVALQMNCKLGGALWALKLPLDKCMICGVDVYHSGTDRMAKGSVAAFVASMDKPLTSWYNKICIQGPNQELIDLLKVCLVSSVNEYRKKNNCYPDRIILYRDGVGDGQLETVAKYEVKQLRMAFSLIDPSYAPKMSIVIVQKRINTRLFSMNGRKLDNPQPGTIVDTTVTRRCLYDFFLISQHVRQGTVSPTHYIVIYDGAEMKPDYMQRLTFKLCHLYYNWPGTIRVPAPCQYAHKLAYLVGQSIQMDPHESLANHLYYL